MPFALVVIGLILIVTGARDTYKQFGQLLVNDFTGPQNFLYWVVAIGSIGALGYIDAFRPFSRAFMALILLAMILKNRGLFDQLTKAIDARKSSVPATSAGASGTPATSSPLASLPALGDTLASLETLAAAL